MACGFPQKLPALMMRPTDQLIASLRTGDLSGVTAALEAGADANLPDNIGVPGLPLRIAAYNGHLEVIRALVSHGGEVNVHCLDARAENLLAVARRGEKKDAVRLLIELGTEITPGLDTGLNLAERLAAQGVANRAGREPARKTPASMPASPPPASATPPAEAGTAPAPGFTPEIPEWMAKAGAEIEEIDLQGCYGVDTNALNADIMRQANRDTAQESQRKPEVDAPLLEFGKRRFWQKKD